MYQNVPKDINADEGIGYKIIEMDVSGNVKTLFHGVNGSRIIQQKTWVPAVEKMVKDGTSKTEYLSGWHILLNLEEAQDYLKVFTQRLDLLKIVPVQYKDIRPKSHSKKPVFLAKSIKFI